MSNLYECDRCKNSSDGYIYIDEDGVMHEYCTDCWVIALGNEAD